MINVNDIKEAFDVIVNATQQGNYTIDNFNVYLNNAVKSLYNQRLGLPERIEFSTASANISYARNKKIHNDLKPFRTRRDVNIVDNTFIDKSALPSDLYYETSVEYISIVKNDKQEAALNRCGCKPYKDNEVVSYKRYIGFLEHVDDDKFATRANSTIITNPIYNTMSEGWRTEFFGFNVNKLRVYYLRVPTKAVWGYTVVNDVEVYDPISSKDVEFSEMLIHEIVARMVKEYSQYNDDANDINYANEKINTGQ